MEYTLGFATDRDGEEASVVDAFVSWYENDTATVVPVGAGKWFVAPDIGFSREDGDDSGDGPLLKTFGFDSDHLYEIISSFFRFVKDRAGYAVVIPFDGDSRHAVVLITNDTNSDVDPLGAETGGLVRRYRAENVLGSTALFASFSGEMFGAAGQAESAAEEEEEGQIVETGVGPWLFDDILGHSDSDEISFLLAVADVEHVLRDVLSLPRYTVYEGDYFTHEDTQTGSIVVAQPFHTAEAVYVELRLALPPTITKERIETRVAESARKAGIDEILSVVEFDDYKGTIQAVPVLQDGTKGRMRILQMDH